MSGDDSSLNRVTPIEDNEAIRHLKQAIAGGRPWHIALLEAIGLWTCPEENHNGHLYCYLIDGEAFDWLLLAERLCLEIADIIPEQELLALLEKEMMEAAEALEFERAAELRDRIRKLKDEPELVRIGEPPARGGRSSSRRDAGPWKPKSDSRRGRRR